MTVNLDWNSLSRQPLFATAYQTQQPKNKSQSRSLEYRTSSQEDFDIIIMQVSRKAGVCVRLLGRISDEVLVGDAWDTPLTCVTDWKISGAVRIK